MLNSNNGECKMAIKDIANGRSDLYRVDPNLIQIKEGWNSREANDPANSTHVAELAASIREVGVKKPLVCYMENEVVYVTDGHCRLQAVMHLIEEGVEIKTVPVMVEDRHANEADRIFSQIVHNAGKPLTSLEQAKVFKRLVDLGWAQKDIASKAGITGGRVSQLLELLILPAILQKYIIEGKASANMVLQLYKKHKQNIDETIMELNGAVKVAEESGRKRAMPKDTAEGGAKKEVSEARQSLKNYLKELVATAYADERVDDTEAMVTITFSEADWAELMEKIDY
jgi:ParB/RepB/Spo0J family partition protein